ncbi:MAG: outer membrane lipoprotein-sorting protein [Myxococcota bacterium]
MPMLPVALLLALLALPAAAPAASPAEACARNVPQPETVRAIRMTSRDRSGEKTIVVLSLYGRRDSEGLGQLFIRMEQPAEIRGTSLLVLEQPKGDSEIYLASPALPKARRITGVSRADGLFRTDFSSEDLERLQQGWRPSEGETRPLPDTHIEGRPVYVVELRPSDSAYERIVLSLDQESCLPLLIQFYEPGKSRARKELSTDPRSNLKHGSIWVAHSALMRDLQNLTTTHLMVDSHEQEALLPDGQFSVEALEHAVQEKATR